MASEGARSDFTDLFAGTLVELNKLAMERIIQCGVISEASKVQMFKEFDALCAETVAENGNSSDDLSSQDKLASLRGEWCISWITERANAWVEENQSEGSENAPGNEVEAASFILSATGRLRDMISAEYGGVGDIDLGEALYIAAMLGAASEVMRSHVYAFDGQAVQRAYSDTAKPGGEKRGRKITEEAKAWGLACRQWVQSAISHGNLGEIGIISASDVADFIRENWSERGGNWGPAGGGKPSHSELTKTHIPEWKKASVEPLTGLRSASKNARNYPV